MDSQKTVKKVERQDTNQNKNVISHMNFVSRIYKNSYNSEVYFVKTLHKINDVSGY